MKNAAFKIQVTLILVFLSGWVLVYNLHHKAIFQKQYSFTVDEAKKFKNFSRVLYAHGLNAWFQNDSDVAANFFRKAALKDIFYMNSWLKLAQAEIALANPDKAKTILKFTDRLTENVYRWKWSQTLLAYELGMEEIVLRNINFLIHHRKMVQDSFQLLDTYFSRSSEDAIQALDSENLVPFLEWLVRWGRVDDTDIAWSKIVESETQNDDIYMKYIHFLVSKKRVRTAANIWRSYTGIENITNSGFEDEITHRGFGWRYTANSKNKWAVRRIMSEAFEGAFSLKIMFEGKKNISFAHLYQIVPVDPLTAYMLTYIWQSKDISTDQGPFVEIYGYDCKGLYFKGPMILHSHEWQKQDIEFEVPENCHAVVVRLRRRPSHRFDNKIAGTLWLDNFKLEKVKKNRQKNNSLVIN